MRHAEALFFVDDQKPQVLEGHIFLQQAVGADDDIDLPLFRPFEDGFLLFRGAEP